MPNHCQNKLTLQNGEDILNVISPYLTKIPPNEVFGTSFYTTYEFDFQKIIPMDEKLLEGEEWYNWRVENWGTKWNGYDGRITDDGSTFTFDTAWSPPLPIIKKLAELTGETLVLQYIEYGMFFCGQYTAGQDGDFDEFYNDIKSAPQELLDSLGYEPWEENEGELV
jgi:hypothetical protein